MRLRRREMEVVFDKRLNKSTGVLCQKFELLLEPETY